MERYRLEVTDPHGRTTRTEFGNRAEITQLMIFAYGFDHREISHGFDVLHRTPVGNIYEFVRFEETDNKQTLLCALRVRREPLRVSA